MVSFEPLAGSIRDYIRIMYRPDPERSGCVERGRPFAPPELPKLPPLVAPPNVSARSTRGGSGSRELHSEAELTGKTGDLAAIVAHYAGQLAVAGWTVSTPALSQKVVAQFLEVTSPSGSQWQGTLMAISTETGATVSISMQPRTKQ